MSSLPAMPFLVDRYLADTTHLSLEEHGAYLLLLLAMWRRNGSIPDDDRDNARMLGLQPRAWLRLKPRLLPFFESYGGCLTQKRLQHQWNYAQENRLRQSEKGKAGAKERWERNQVIKSSRGYSTGKALANGKGNGESTSPRYGRPIASIKEDITTTSNSPATASEEVTEKPAEEFPELPDRLNRLLNTPLMRRAK